MFFFRKQAQFTSNFGSSLPPWKVHEPTFLWFGLPGPLLRKGGLEKGVCIKFSGKKKEPKPKLFGSDIFRWGGGLPREGAGAKEFGMSLETGKPNFLAGYAGILLGYPGGARKVREKKVCVQFSSPKLRSLSTQGLLHTEFGAENKSALFQDFLLLSAVLRVRGRFHNPRQTLVRTKLRLKCFPRIVRN